MSSVFKIDRLQIENGLERKLLPYINKNAKSLELADNIYNIHNIILTTTRFYLFIIFSNIRICIKICNLLRRIIKNPVKKIKNINLYSEYIRIIEFKLPIGMYSKKKNCDS